MAKCNSIWGSTNEKSPLRQTLQKRKKKKMDFFKQQYSTETTKAIESTFKATMEQGRGPGPCPECGAKTNLLKGRFGKFYGCSTFSECRGTRDYVATKEKYYKGSSTVWHETI